MFNLRLSLRLLPLVLVVAPLIARADDCNEKGTQAEMNACATEEYNSANKRLTQAVDDYRARLDAKQKRMFNEAHAAWSKYRTAQCEFQASSVTGAPSFAYVRDSCLTHLTIDRYVEMTELGKCETADVSCPHVAPPVPPPPAALH